MFEPRLDILPAAQRAVWPNLMKVPHDFVLYGGTALALRLGHRESVDFDFFSDVPLAANRKATLLQLAFLSGADVLQDALDTLVVTAQGVKFAFYGAIGGGRVGLPMRTSDNVLTIASLEDVFARKLKALHDRAEGRDYQDIAAILDSGMSLSMGLAAAQAIYPQFSVASALRALVYFDDLNEPNRVSADIRQALIDAVTTVPPAWPGLPIRSLSLA